MIDGQELQRAIGFGMDVEAFLKSSIGQYLSERGESERSQALEDLAECAPEDSEAIRALQNKVRVVDLIMTWLAETITEGMEAQRQLTEAQEE